MACRGPDNLNFENAKKILVRKKFVIQWVLLVR